VIALFACFYFLTPPAGWRVCLFHWVTGRECPLCGLTRGLCALAKGRVAEAVGWNALTPLAAVMLAALGWRGRWTGHLWTAGIATFAIYGIYRIAA
jgi:hypothetical protein